MVSPEDRHEGKKETPQKVEEGSPAEPSAPEGGETKRSSTASDAKAGYFYGWGRQLKLAWRASSTDAKRRKEYSKPPQADGEPTVAAVCRFDDGDEYRVADMTCEQWQASQKRTRPSDAPMWEGEHSLRHHRVHVDQRVDRRLLLSMYEQSRQVLRIKVGQFGPLEGAQPCKVPRNSPALKAAMTVMQPLAEGWCTGKYADNAALRAARDELLKVNRRPSFKRLASSAARKEGEEAEEKPEEEEEEEEEEKEEENDKHEE